MFYSGSALAAYVPRAFSLGENTTLEYIILSIDDSRLEKKTKIRNQLSSWSERQIDCVNGHTPGEIKRYKEAHGIQTFPMLPGELGVWFSVMNAWESIALQGPAVVFEDDAILREDFLEVFEKAIQELPNDADFLTLFIPYNQAQDFYYVVKYDNEGVPRIEATNVPEEKSMFNIGSKYIAKAYMGYGNVAMYFTQKGAKKLLSIAKDRGTYSPVDCFMFLQAHANNVNGYALHPRHHGVVDVDWEAETQIHFGERVTE